jgi:hypothetical protein
MKITRRSDIDSEKLLQEVNLEEFFLWNKPIKK